MGLMARSRMVGLSMVALFSMVLLIVSQSSLQQARLLRRQESTLHRPEVNYLPKLQQTRLTFLGYDMAAADILWVRVINYFSRHFRSDRKYPHLAPLMDQILTLDPDFHDAYYWGGSSTLYGQFLNNDVVHQANRYYKMALKRFVNDFESAYRLGMNYHAELQSDDPKIREGFRRQGLKYLEMAANMPGAPQRIIELVAGLNAKYGADALAVQYLTDLLLRTENPAEREKLLLRINGLSQGERTQELKAWQETFSKRWLNERPYVHQFFFVQTESTKAAGVDHWSKLVNHVDLTQAQQELSED